MAEDAVLRVQATIDAPGLADASHSEFARLVRMVGSTFAELAKGAGVDHLDVDCVLAEDFVAAVNVRLRQLGDGDQEGFTTERVGGMVVGKNLPQTEDASVVAIVFAPDAWNDDPGGAAYRVALIAHEIAHSVLSRVRRMSGALEGVEFPSQTLTEVARSSARIDWDEYRAEALADLIVKTTMTVSTDNGGSRPARLADISGSAYQSQVLDQLTRAYPAWPDRVQAYRKRRMTLDEMWTQTLREVSQMRTVVAMMLGAMGIDADAAPPDEVLNLPAYGLYFGSPWEAYIGACRSAPLITNVGEHREVEQEILRLGDLSFREALKALGLRADDLPGRQAHVHVTTPRWVS